MRRADRIVAIRAAPPGPDESPGNAIKFTEHGDVTVQVYLEEETEGRPAPI